MNRIVRVYGYCDDWQVEFSRVDEYRWSCQIPPDLTDGQYACQFYAVNDDDDIGFWCGVLYVSSGKICVTLSDDPISYIYVHESLTFSVETSEEPYIAVVQEDFEFCVEDETLIFVVIKECEHG